MSEDASYINKVNKAAKAKRYILFSPFMEEVDKNKKIFRDLEQEVLNMGYTERDFQRDTVDKYLENLRSE